MFDSEGGMRRRAGRSPVLALVVALGLSAWPWPVAAQEMERGGLWLSVGAGGGVDFADEGVGGAGEPGGGGYVRIGGTIDRRFRVAGEAIAWVGQPADETLMRANAVVSLVLTPFRRPSVFAKVGFGGAAVEFGDEDGLAYGFGAVVGLGIDLALGPHVYLTPGVDLLIQTFERRPTGARTNDILLVTIGLTWR